MLSLSGCAQDRAKPGTIRVLATTAMVADLVKAVGGDHVEVTTLMGPGIDPHLFKASPRDVMALKSADVVIASGLHLEGKLLSALESLQRTDPVLFIGDHLPEERLLSTDGAHDPHIWFDVALFAKTLPSIEAQLSKLLPEYATEFKANRLQKEKSLEELDAWARKEIGSIPISRRVLITSHDAFRYFGRAYDIEVRGVQGLSTESEAGLKEVNKLVELVVNNRISAVFAETSVSNKNISSLVEGAAAAGHRVKFGKPLYSDAMGDPGTDAGTYEGMVRANVNSIVEALR